MSTKIIEVTGTQPLVTVDDNVSNVEVVNQPIEVTVSSAVAVGNTAIRNALDAYDPIRYDKTSGVISFIDRSEVVRSEKMMDPAATPIYVGDGSGVATLDSEKFDIFTIQIAGDITEFDFGNIASGQTVTIICTQSMTPGGQIDESSGNWSNWFWTNNNNHFPENQYDTFIIKVLWTGNTYYASLIEFDTVMPDTQVGIPVGPDEPSNPEPGWLWYDTTNSLLMIYVDGAWVVAGGGGGANVFVGPEPGPTDPQEGDLWYNTSLSEPMLQVYVGNTWQNSVAQEGPRGFTGSQGALGYTGSRGDIGYTGSQGSDSVVPGPTGSRGDTGFTGSLGFTGSRGFTGSKGFDGSQGSAGYNGSKGDQGAIGYTGSQGAGYTGSQGSQGIQGSTGYSGSQGDIGYTGSKGDVGFTGSASTEPGPIGFTGSKGDIGFTGSASTEPGPIGFTGSKGDDGAIGLDFEPTGDNLLYARTYDGVSDEGQWRLNIIQSDPPDDGEQYARVRQVGQDIGEWELVVATGGGEWDGILYDKPAVIQQPQGLTDFNNTNSGIQIGKNGFDTDDQTVIPVETGQHNNLVIGRNSYIKDGTKNLTLVGSDLQVGGGLSVPDNTAIFGNLETKKFYLGTTLLAEDDSIDKYGSTYDVLKLTPVAERDLVITAQGSIILANNTGSPDQGIQINASRLRYRGSLLPNSNDADANTIRKHIYFDATNILSSAYDIRQVSTEDNELISQTSTWQSRRQLNYISPERIRFRKFAECVNYQTPGSMDPQYPDQSYADTDMDIDLDRGTIQHKILTDNVININITDLEWTSGTTLRDMGHVDHQPEPGTSITIILYHQDDIRTIAWPTNFKFLAGDSDLTTQAGSATTENINGIAVSNIVAIDMLHSFYDGQTWWSSITRGYA